MESTGVIPSTDREREKPGAREVAEHLLALRAEGGA
jgi:hypothetical protein